MRKHVACTLAVMAVFMAAPAPAATPERQAGLPPAQAAVDAPTPGEVTTTVIAAMAAAADQAREARRAEDPGARPAREVFETAEAVRTAMIEAARREVGRRWNGTVYIPPNPTDPQAIKICFGKLGCFEIRIRITIESV